VLVTLVNDFHRLDAATALTPKLPHPTAAVGGGGVGQLSEGARFVLACETCDPARRALLQQNAGDGFLKC